MNQSHTNELKGLAMLMIIFSHIGYFLFTDHRFLYPISIAAGVGVNIFLFLSGFGLTSSEIVSQKSPLQFYKKRLKNIFVPMWVVLLFILVADWLLLGKTYETTVVIQSILGFFPRADIFTSLNSPLWYFTFILFYYLTFPLIFRKKRPAVSIIALLLLGYLVTKVTLPVSEAVQKLYQLHYLSFPLGMAFAYLNLKKLSVLANQIFVKLQIGAPVKNLVRVSLIILTSLAVAHAAINSGIGKSVLTEQFISILTLLGLVLIFLLKNIQSDFLIILGKYSYEIYLIQWPLMYRFDFIYKHTPAFLGTILYILVFILLGLALNKFVKLVIKAK